jgi:hypothetical protein
MPSRYLPDSPQHEMKTRSFARTHMFDAVRVCGLIQTLLS